MSIKTIIFDIVLISAFAAAGLNVRRLIEFLRLGKWVNRFDQPMVRMQRVLTIAIGQTKIFRDPVAGPIHAFIFWGFMALIFAVIESIGEGVTGGAFSLSFLGPLYPVITVSQDIFILLIIVGVIGSLWRRFVSKIKRLQGDEHEKKDAALILYTIMTIVTALLVTNAARIAMGGQYPLEMRPLALMLAHIFGTKSAAGIWTSAGGWVNAVYEFAWWLHIVLVLGFLNYLPYSKHLHVMTSIPNVFFSDLKKKNALRPINFEDETIVKYGASDIEDLTWKQLLDGDTCTHCGRCSSVCPANLTGKVLDPRWIIIATRERMLDKAPHLIASNQFGFGSWEAEIQHSTNPNVHILPDVATASTDAKSAEGMLLFQKPKMDAAAVEEKKFVGDYITQEALWQCTTCQACMQECPVMIEHVDEIVDLRRNLVMMEASFPPELQPAFTSMENNYSPWAFSPSERADWAQGMGIKTMADYAMEQSTKGVEVDAKKDEIVLFWVGCAGSYDERVKNITKAFAEIMQIAKIDFRILGTEEKCTGDPARRMGNEYLAQTLIKDNIAMLNSYKVARVVTTCPHCFNAIKNEWGDFGGHYDVTHHTEFIGELLASGRINPSKDLLERVTYHDSCYLGRSNDIYDAPRAALESIPGLEIIEMDRSKSRGLCCGAGGGQMWMEEKEGKRINIERTEEAMATGATTIASACPFCMTMMTDGVKAKDAVDTVQVKDIAELVLAAMR